MSLDTALQVPEQVGAAGGGVLGHQMATVLEQAALAEGKERRAADRKLVAELLRGVPGGWMSWQRMLPGNGSLTG